MDYRRWQKLMNKIHISGFFINCKELLEITLGPGL